MTFRIRRFRTLRLASPGPLIVLVGLAAIGLAMSTRPLSAAQAGGVPTAKTKRPPIKRAQGGKITPPSETGDQRILRRVIEEARSGRGSSVFNRLHQEARQATTDQNLPHVLALRAQVAELQHGLKQRVDALRAEFKGTDGLAQRILANRRAAKGDPRLENEIQFHLDTCLLNSNTHGILALTKLKVFRGQNGNDTRALLTDLIDRDGQVNSRKLAHLRIAKDIAVQRREQDPGLAAFAREAYQRAVAASRISELRDLLGIRPRAAGDNRRASDVTIATLQGMTHTERAAYVARYRKALLQLPADHPLAQHAVAVLNGIGIRGSAAKFTTVPPQLRPAPKSRGHAGMVP